MFKSRLSNYFSAFNLKLCFLSENCFFKWEDKVYIIIQTATLASSIKFEFRADAGLIVGITWSQFNVIQNYTFE